MSKLVISEELNLKPDSAQGNALKTFITESEVTVERIGQEAERTKQSCCFLFTTNHLPLWIEENDKRYYVVDIDRDGHANGPQAEESSELVGELKDEMGKEGFIASLYRALMERRLNDQFSAKTLNVTKVATDVMRRVHGASEQTSTALMREYLDELDQHAVAEADVVGIIVEKLRGNPNSAKHVMTKLGCSKQKAKWGGKDYARAIWVRQNHWIEKGIVKGPDGYSQKVVEHIKDTF